MRRDERVRVPEQSVDSPYDRPTAPSGIPVAPPPRQSEPDHDGAVPPGPGEPDSPDPGRAGPPAFTSAGTAAPADMGIVAPPDLKEEDAEGTARLDPGKTDPEPVTVDDTGDDTGDDTVDDAGRAEPPPAEEVFGGGEDAERFRGRLRELQGDFVDDPERAVRGAGELVGEVLSALNEHKRTLDETWHGGDTEQLRVALRRYRAFLDRLLVA